MRNSSKTIGIISRNHQYKDGQGYRITTYGEKAIHDQCCGSHMRQSDIVDHKMSVEDCISASNSEALEDLPLSLIKQEETNSAHEGTYIRVSIDTFETEPKSRMSKWFEGLCARIVIAYIIITNFFRKK